jgi:aryl-alcohol dehydrogenase-like predicted oxidoreductase
VQKNTIGRTNLLVSQIGLGTVKFGRNQQIKYPSPFELPTDRDIVNLLDFARDLGVNLLDTAPAYGTSEERLGKLLGAQRHHWVISTKVGEEFINGQSHFDFSPAHVRSSIDRSLKRLKTDYLDLVLVHSNGEDTKIIEEYAIFDLLNTLKEAGKIRTYGMSTKTIEGGILAVDQSDVVMVTYNPIDTTEKPVISHAHKKNKGVLIKKALASGHLHKMSGDDPVYTAMQFILKEPGINSIILGTLNKDHLAHASKCLE